jgi:peptidoglycan/LPS O-acetylase OafA/YrhL
VTEPRPFVSIQQALGGTDNALGLVRLVLAALVVLDHTFPLGGWGNDPVLTWTNGQANTGGVAVAGFFAISGYLIAKSGLRSDLVQFLWHRVLRIFPAFWTVLIVTAFVIGPLLWIGMSRPIGDYFTGADGPFHYVSANWTLRLGTWGIHDLLIDTPYGQEVNQSVFNGSLWTLWYEWLCYLMIGAFVLFAVLRRAKLVVVGATLFFLILQVAQNIAPGSPGMIVPWLGDPFLISLGLTFLVGSSIAVYSDKVPFDNWLGVFALLVTGATLRVGGFNTIGTIAGVYAVLWLGAMLPKSFRRVGAVNDYSYGLYIWGFPITQILAWAGLQAYGWPLFAVTALVASFALAWLSWHGVEKWALRLKRWGPGRGVRHWWDWVRGLRRPAPAGPVDPAP